MDPRRSLAPFLGVGPRRGVIMRVRMGLRGWGPGDYVDIYHGVIHNIVRKGANNWTLILRGLTTALSHRNTTTGGNTPLFYTFPDENTAPSTTTIRNKFTPGNTTLDVNATTFAARETGGRYYVTVQADSGTEFITSGTAVTATQYTNGGGALTANLGSALGVAGVGQAATFLWGIADHPIDIVRKIITSTGAANNGTYDTLPEAWGLALDQIFIDDQDCDDFKLLALPAETWLVVGTNEITDAYDWMHSWLRQGGFFLTEHEGKLTCRAIGNTFSDVTSLDYVVAPGEIMEYQSYETYSSDQMVEEANVILTHPNPVVLTTSAEEITTRPQHYWLRSRIEALDTNVGTWHADIISRAGYWSMRITEQITVKLNGFRLSHLAPGSHIYFDVPWISSRADVAGVPWTVLSVEPDWFRGFVIIQAALVPINEWE
jgi:hypothetical protein